MDRFKRNEAIRTFYEAVLPLIEETQPYRWAIDTYSLAWIMADATPIEAAMWSDLREEGFVMYPQVPVGRFFVDFGNPVAKVAIECDGAHHQMQREEDAERQREIEKRGWTVFRIVGTACLRNGRVGVYRNEIEEGDDYSDSQALIRRIASEFPICARLARRMPAHEDMAEFQQRKRATA